MELVKREFLGRACPRVMISEVLLISKPRADESRCFGISRCSGLLPPGILEEFRNSFVGENSNLVNVSKGSWFVIDAQRLCRTGTGGLLMSLAQHGQLRVAPSFPRCLRWQQGRRCGQSCDSCGIFQACLVWGADSLSPQPVAVRADTTALCGAAAEQTSQSARAAQQVLRVPFPYSPATGCDPCDKQTVELNWIQSSCFCTRLVLAGLSCSRRSLVPVQRREGRACGATAFTACCSGVFWGSSAGAVPALQLLP